MDFPQCTEETQKRKITIKDPQSKNSKSEVLLENPQGTTIKIIQIDGCVIKGSKQMRCDRLVIIPNQELIFIELKGKKIDQAFKQLLATLTYIYQACSSTQNYRITGIIACTRCPLAATDIQNLKAKFRKQCHGKLLIQSGSVPYSLQGNL